MEMIQLIERRSVGRMPSSKGVLLFSSTQRGVFTGVVTDLSNVGACIRLNGANLFPLEFQLSFDNFRTVRRCRLIWRRDDFLGVAFDN